MLDSAEARKALVAMPAAGLLHGEVSAVERDYRWVRPLRFCDDQLRALGSCQAWHPGLFRQMARTTAGICIEFETDAREVALEVRVDGEPKGTRAVLEVIDRDNPAGPEPHDGISADIESRHVWCGMPENDLVFLELAGHDPEDSLGLVPLPGMERTRHVRIWLPALRGALVRDVICDGSFVRPVARRGQLLALGDSIVQGFVSGDPARSWPALLAMRQDLDLVNQGVGGQVFQPGSLFGLAGYINPARIVVSFGENYRYEPCMARRVSLDIRGYLGEVHRLWPQVPVHVLTPLWHDEEASPSHGMSCFEHVADLIAAQVESFDNMTLLDGLELLEHDAALLADGYEHPNERGCRQIATRINTVMRVPGLRPSSVGKRRKPRKRVVREHKDFGSDSAPLPFEETS
jgi:hypothetical protein